MNRNADNHNRSSVFFDSSNEGIKEYQKKGQQIRREQEAFLQREVDYRDYVFAPEGYEGIMLFIYILTIPYLVGLMFLFLFIARTSYEYFLEFNLASYFVIWAIGYEVCAVSLLVIFFYAWLTDKSSDDNMGNKRSVQPRFRN